MARIAIVGCAVAVVATACGRRPTVNTLPTRNLEGTIAATDESPVAGATVELGSDPPDRRVPIAVTTTDGHGKFRIRRIPTGSFRLTASHRGHVTASVHVDIRPTDTGKVGEPDADSYVRLVLDSAVALAGIVEDTRGAPVPLARVLVLAPAGALGAVVPTRAADARGYFRFDNLSAGTYRLLIEAPGLGTSEVARVAAPDESVRVVLPGESRLVQGHVRHDARLVAGARVILAGEGVSEARRAETDAQGHFVFGGLGPGTYTLRAESGGLVSQFATNVVIDHQARRRAEVNLQMAPGNFLRGRVVDQAGIAVAAAQIKLDTIPPWGMFDDITADDKGAWSSAALPLGRYRVQASREGFVSRRTATVDLAVAATPSTPTTGTTSGNTTDPAARSLVLAREVVLELARTGSVVGRIVDEGGQPIAGARVRRQTAAIEDLGVISTPLPLAAEAAALPGSPGRRVSAPQLPSLSLSPPDEAVTGHDGKFHLIDLAPGHLRFEIVHPHALPMATELVTLGPGQQRDLGDLRLERAIRLVGRVLAGGSGAPIPGARVSAARVPPAPTASASASATVSATATANAATDAGGNFSLPLATGMFRITASSPQSDDASAVVQIDTKKGGSPGPIALTLNPRAESPETLYVGRVKDNEGRPLANARVTLVNANASPETPVGVDVGFSTNTDAGGQYRLRARTPDGWRAASAIEVSHPSYPSVRVPVPATTTDGQANQQPSSSSRPANIAVDVTVPVPGAIRGEVHERLTGAPVANFQIHGTGPSGAHARHPADTRKRRGRDVLGFVLPRLLPGKWTLEVNAPGFHGASHVLTVPPASSVGDLSVRDVRIEMDRLPP